MREIRYTLLSDGPSDDALLPMLTWLLRQCGFVGKSVPIWADSTRLPRPPKGLLERIEQALNLYPGDLPFVHRDAENQDPALRHEEIEEASAALAEKGKLLPAVVHVVPVRMTEAWLLFDENAIRRAAGNPTGSEPLELPPIHKVDLLSDPKAILHTLLRTAKNATGRRLRKFSAPESARRVPAFLDDFSPLRAVSAFCELEAAVTKVVSDHHWDQP